MSAATTAINGVRRSGGVVGDSQNGPRPATSEEAAGRADPVPARAAGLELLGEVSGSGYRRPPALARRADGQTIQLTPILYYLLVEIDGERGHADLAASLSRHIGKHATEEDVRFLAETKLRPLGLLRSGDGSEPKVEKANPLLALRFKFIVSDPELTRRLTAPFVPLFRPLAVAATLAMFAAAVWWVAFEKGLASAAREALYQPGLLLLVVTLTVLSAGFHELGHAAACRYSGARPGAMGVGLYLVWPAFYTDVTDSYRLGRRDRLRVDLGGLYFNAIFGVATIAIWIAVRWDALLLVIIAQVLQMARQLVPVVRFDGYHVLADITGVPDLFAHIKPTLLGVLPTRWGQPETGALKPWARVVVTLWVVLVVPLLLMLFVLAVLVLPRLAATAWDSLGLQWHALAASAQRLDAPSVVLGLVSMLTISLPVLGIVYLLARVVRRTTGKVWRTTAGRPPLRVAAALAAAGVVTAVGWAWWPDGQYQPLRAEDQLRLADAPPEPAQEVAAPPALPQATATRLSTVLSTESAPTPAAGQWMLVLLPASDAESAAENTPATGPLVVPPEAPPQGEQVVDPAPAPWPFPFAPPRAPREGDNQALAVNTVDGAATSNVALALVWVTDGSAVDQRNEAYALASCSNCKTLAVAFQVVLVVGYAQVATPINAAVALNYLCSECDTHALAVQLVATLSRAPNEEVERELARIWAELESISTTFTIRPLDEVYGILLETRTAILKLLSQEDGPPSAAASGGATPAPPDVDVDVDVDVAAAEVVAPAPAVASMGGSATTAEPPPPPDTSTASSPDEPVPPNTATTAEPAAGSATTQGETAPETDPTPNEPQPETVTTTTTVP